MRRSFVVVVGLAAVVAVAGCGGSQSSPSAPTPAPATTFALSGTVRSADTQAIAGAAVLILDGPNANRNVLTASDGQYQLSGLQAGGFTIRVSAVDYEPTTRPVTLTAATVLNVDLARLPRAVIENVDDTVQGILLPDGNFAIAPTGINRGTGCAGSIAGSTELSNTASGLLQTIAWALPAGTIVRPGERFTYQVCCIPRAQAFTAGASYFTRFTWNTVSCS